MRGKGWEGLMSRVKIHVIICEDDKLNIGYECLADYDILVTKFWLRALKSVEKISAANRHFLNYLHLT